jgi:hypothetical protein
MKPESDPVACLLTELPNLELPEDLRRRTLTLARAHLAPSPESVPLPLGQTLPNYATSAALLSADAAFLVNACLNISRAFGG